MYEPCHMSSLSLEKLREVLTTTVADIGLKVLAAFAFWVAGRWLIHAAVRVC